MICLFCLVVLCACVPGWWFLGGDGDGSVNIRLLLLYHTHLPKV